MVTHSITTATRPAATTFASRPGACLRTWLTGCAVAACVAGLTAAPNSAAAQSGSCLQDPSLDQPPAELPADVCGAGEIVDSDFYALSWQMFKFLVWPAASARRGTSDTAKSITSMEGPRVFETYKASWEIFRRNAEEPVAWKDYPATPCSNQPDIGPGALVLASFSKYGPITVGGRSNSHVLVAQNRSYVRYQSGYNEILFDKIKDSHLYDASVVGAVPPADSQGPIDSVTKSPHRAMTVKSAWIELPGASGNIDPSKFYVRRDAWVQIPGTDECRKADVGLVGLHIVYKTASRPQWIWSTFEHIDNVPEPGDEEGKRYTFHNGDPGTPMTDEPEDDFRLPKPDGAAGPGEPPRPYQVERRQKIDSKVLHVNAVWQDELGQIGSVWRNYKLVMSQWPLVPFIPDEDAANIRPMPACDETDITPATANTTMETFQQSCARKLTCMGCHNATRTTDFIWAISLNRYTPTRFRSLPRRTTAIETLQDILGKRERK